MVDEETGEHIGRRAFPLPTTHSPAQNKVDGTQEPWEVASNVAAESHWKKKKPSALSRLASKSDGKPNSVNINDDAVKPRDHGSNEAADNDGSNSSFDPSGDTYPLNDSELAAISNRKKKSSLFGKLVEKRRASNGGSQTSLRSQLSDNEQSLYDRSSSQSNEEGATEQHNGEATALVISSTLDSKTDNSTPAKASPARSTQKTGNQVSPITLHTLANGKEGIEKQAPLVKPAASPSPSHSDAEDIAEMASNFQDILENRSTLKSNDIDGNLSALGASAMKMSSSLPNVSEVEDTREKHKNHWKAALQNGSSPALQITRPSDTGSLSVRSLGSTTVSATTRQARQRNFLVGGISSGGGLLGTEELERLFPDRSMTLFVGTWNVAEMKVVPQDVNDLLLPEAIENLADVFVLTLQENSADRKEWAVKLQETLGPSHVLYSFEEHGSLLLFIFVRRDLIWHLSVSESATVTTRAFVQWKTKGAIAISFTLFGTSFLFIGCHLKAHHGRTKERLQDCDIICKGLNLPREVVHDKYVRSPDVTARFDVVFWCGDLNFRLNRSREQVMQIIEAGGSSSATSDYEALLMHDELSTARNEGSVFQEFQEGRITFQPSFKFDIDSDQYDTSQKLRIPSYTDRVLFRSKKKNAIACSHYGIVSTLRHSDHRAVYGIYRVSVRPGRDTIPLSGGQFNREVYLEAAKRRSLQKLVSKIGKSSSSSAICSVM